MRYLLAFVILLILFQRSLSADCGKTVSEAEGKSLIEQAVNLNGLLGSLSKVDGVNGVDLTSSSAAIGGGQISYQLKLYVDGTVWCNYDIALSLSIQPTCTNGMLAFTPIGYVVDSVTGGGSGCPKPDEIKNDKLPPVLQPFLNQNFATNQSCESLSVESGSLCLDSYDPAMVDHDGDGVTEGEGDCDDDNPAIYPGATEVVDDLDNDCDGVVDNVPTVLDDDGDGLSEEEGDCDDTNADIFPGASDDQCDGVDNDCTGVPDDALSTDCDQDGVVLPIILSLLLDDEVTDQDGDGIEDEKDNCPKAKNSDQKDPNGNGLGQACDKSENSLLQFMEAVKKGKLKVQDRFKIDPKKFKQQYWKPKWFP